VANQAGGTPANGFWDRWFRERLATIVLLVSILAVGILAGIAIHGDRSQAKDILTMILPMIGTWVGTVLAFYFGKEQLEAATRSVTSIARQLTPDEKLRSLRVTEKMIPRAAAYLLTTNPDQIKLLEAVANLDRERKGNRLPVLTVDGSPRCVIHRSTIDRFIARAAAAGKAAPELQALTLQDVLADPEFGARLQTSFGTVAEDATLADAKRAMESVPWCQDTFVTHGGSREEPVSAGSPT
jgi:uncharacterized membrane protein YeaQ/YmgE (transglycosylase-associated protein family)